MLYAMIFPNTSMLFKLKIVSIICNAVLKITNTCNRAYVLIINYHLYTIIKSKINSKLKSVCLTSDLFKINAKCNVKSLNLVDILARLLKFLYFLCRFSVNLLYMYIIELLKDMLYTRAFYSNEPK